MVVVKPPREPAATACHANVRRANPEPDPTDAQRYPILSPHGSAMLKFLREHPHAPIYRKQSGHRLIATDLPDLRAFEQWARIAVIDNDPQVPPPWIAEFLRTTAIRIPAYRIALAGITDFRQLPCFSRADLSAT